MANGTAPARPQAPRPDPIARAKDVLHLVREAVLIGVVGLLLLAPGCVRETLVDAGFTRASIGGFEMSLVEEAAEETADALLAVDAAQAQADSVLGALATVADETTDPETRERVTEARDRIAETAAATGAAADVLAEHLVRQQAVLVEQPTAADPATVRRVDSVLAGRSRTPRVARPAID